MEDNWNAVIVPTMFEGARAICLGTRFRHDDIHSRTFLPANGWKQIVQSAITVDKEGEEMSYWPDMWSLDYLSQRRRIAPIAFSYQYQNQVVQTSELSLSPDLIVKGTISTDFDALGVGVDLSAGVRERNDYTVFVMGGRVKDKIHIIDCKRVRVMGNLEKLELLMEMMEEWGVIMKDGKNYFPTGTSLHVWSEAVAYQASLEADFKRICQTEQGLYNLIWHPVKGFRGDKVARFRGIMGLFEQRKIIFNKYRKFGALTDEIVNFGVSSHDDCVDALVWLCNGLMTRGKLELEY
jgi:phage terminase large subunit-like protein